MSFTSLKFLIFFAAAAVCFYVLPKKLQKYCLLAASYTFYVFASGKLALILLADTLVSYVCALGAQRAWLGRKKLWTTLGVLSVLAVLFLFKYFDFFCAALLPSFGVSCRRLQLLLPVGISFFSFAVCGYLFDVRSGKLAAEENLIDYANFVAFFPAIMSGPIGRARDFLPQLKLPTVYSKENVRQGIVRFVWGAFKKLVVADTLLQLVNAAYADPAVVSGGAMLAAVLVYSLQLYFDFAAYSDMAIGTACVLGLRVQENFSAPYFSRSIREFWRKWHMSLIGWLREYLYFPLGGSRRGSARTKLNVLIVFIVSGLWHGAALTYLFWGLLNGLYQVIGILTEPTRERLRARLHIREKSPLLAVCQAVCVFLLLSAARIFFRAESMAQAVFVIKHILLIFRDGFGFASLAAMVSPRQLIMMLAVLTPCVIEDIRISRGKKHFAALGDSPWLFWGVILLLTLVIFIFGVYGDGIDMRQFVYFQF